MGAFFNKIGGFFKNLFNSVPTFAQKASGAIKYIAPLASTVVGLIFGSDASEEAKSIAHEFQVDLALVAALIAESHGASVPEGLTNALNSLNSRLTDLLSAGHIKNPDLLNKIKIPVGLISAEIQAIMSDLPQKPA